MLTKYTILTFCFFLFLNPTEKVFKVDTINQVDSWMESMIPDDKPPFYKIRLSNDESELGMIVYPPYSESEFSNDDIQRMIEELLTYKGDTRKCFMKVKCDSYSGDLKQYSLQVEALFMINSLFFEDFSSFSPCTILKDDAGTEATTDGEIVDKAFAAYETWFVKVKEMGIGAAKAAKLNPLEGTGIQWYK